MSFNNFSDFLSMGGHGLYVWLAYGSGVIVLLGLCIEPVIQRKTLIRELTQLYRRQSVNPNDLNKKFNANDEEARF